MESSTRGVFHMKPRSDFRAKCVIVAMVLGVLLGLIVPARISAQMVGATISGTVVDTTGAVIPNVKIVIKNASTGSIANAVTNGVGVFNAPNLPPGTYEFTASATGFSSQVRDHVTLTV